MSGDMRFPDLNMEKTKQKQKLLKHRNISLKKNETCKTNNDVFDKR